MRSHLSFKFAPGPRCFHDDPDNREAENLIGQTLNVLIGGTNTDTFRRNE